MQQNSNVYSFTMHARVNLVIPAGHAKVVVDLAYMYYCFTFLPDLCMNVPEDNYHHFNVSLVQFHITLLTEALSE